MLTDRSGVGVRSGRPAGRGRQRAHLHARGWQSRKAPTHPVPAGAKATPASRRLQSSPGQYGRHVTSCVHVPVCVPNRMHLPRLYSAAGLPPGPRSRARQANQPGNYQHSHETSSRAHVHVRTRRGCPCRSKRVRTLILSCRVPATRCMHASYTRRIHARAQATKSQHANTTRETKPKQNDSAGVHLNPGGPGPGRHLLPCWARPIMQAR